MTAKQYLSQLRCLDRRVETLMEQAERARARLARVTALYGSTPGGAGQTDWTDTLARLIDEEQALNAEFGRLADAKTAALRAIARLPDPNHRLVLELRYLNHMTQTRTAAQMHCDRRTVQRWESKALALLRVPEDPPSP